MTILAWCKIVCFKKAKPAWPGGWPWRRATPYCPAGLGKSDYASRKIVCFERAKPLLCCAVLVLFFGCKPQEEILSSRPEPLAFSENAIVFDTVFTALPNVTQQFHVRNPNRNAVLIESVRLGGGGASPYQVLVGGRAISGMPPVQLRGGDSLQVLVKVRIPPRDSANAFVVYDSLLFQIRNTLQNVKLLAWGQDAVFVKNSSIQCNETWRAGKPYILYDSVIVPAGCQLTMQPGTRIYGFNNAALIVEGTLHANGTAQNPIIFTGFRQDGVYREAPGVWQGIGFRGPSQGNRLDFVQIRNAVNAVHVDIPDNDAVPDLVVQNAVIQYARQAGLLAIDSDVQMVNTQITQCGEFHFAGVGGGSYQLLHCTLVGEPYLMQRENPALLFANFVRVNGRKRQNGLSCEVKNSVVWGVLPEEVGLLQTAGSDFSWKAGNNLLKTTPETVATFGSGTGSILGRNPKFVSMARLNFRPDTLSPLIDAGIPLNIPRDITGKPRDAKPDIGAYER